MREMTKKQPTVMLRSEYNLHYLAVEIADLPHNDVKEFIKELDGMMEDYDFTKSLMLYFMKEMEAEGYVYRPKKSVKVHP